MIKTLILKNLILVEDAQVSFEKGLTMITGETGAGKTALIEAIRLILGERADSSKVRKGCEKAVVQASFELDLSLDAKALLDEGGISIASDEEIILTREISSSGKSRAFICGQMVSAAFLQQLAPYLVDFIAQHSQVELKSSETQRALLDRYLEVDLTSFQLLWEKEKELQTQIDLLQEKKGGGDERQILLKNQLDALLEADIKEGEDEALFEEYKLLANSQELLSTSDQIIAQSDEAIERCVHISALLGSILKYDSKLEEVQKMGLEARLQLAEISSQMQSFQSKIENNPNRLQFIEDRLKTLGALKKKHGKNLWAAKEAIQQELQSLETIDETLESLNQELALSQKKTAKACEEITAIRKKGAIELAKRLSQSLQTLNIPSAQVTIQIDQAARTKAGEDKVHFFLRANLGEQPTLVKDSSSGGELSRLLFSLKIAMVESKTMIFDEIDANVGGETARIIGQQLQELGKLRQILCITHFPQVARYGDHHLRILKEESGGRTRSIIEFVSSDAKEEELLRMSGIASS